MNTEQHRALPQPTEIPRVAAAPLWTSLLAPPLVTVTSGLLIGFVRLRAVKETFYLSIPLLAAALIIGFAFLFSSSVGRRYRGTSLVFLVFSYLFGQCIVCLTLWIGSCILVL